MIKQILSSTKYHENHEKNIDQCYHDHPLSKGGEHLRVSRIEEHNHKPRPSPVIDYTPNFIEKIWLQKECPRRPIEDEQLAIPEECSMCTFVPAAYSLPENLEGSGYVSEFIGLGLCV